MNAKDCLVLNLNENWKNKEFSRTILRGQGQGPSFQGQGQGQGFEIDPQGVLKYKDQDKDLHSCLLVKIRKTFQNN